MSSFRAKGLNKKNTYTPISSVLCMTSKTPIIISNNPVHLYLPGIEQRNPSLPSAKLRALSQYATLVDGNKCYRLSNISYRPHLDERTVLGTVQRFRRFSPILLILFLHPQIKERESKIRMAARAVRDFLELDKLPRSFSSLSHTPHQPLLKSSSIIEPGDANTANAYSDSFIDSSRKENGDEK